MLFVNKAFLSETRRPDSLVSEKWPATQTEQYQKHKSSPTNNAKPTPNKKNIIPLWLSWGQLQR